jgi:hypothetical protein
MNAALLPLLPKGVRFRNRNFRLLKDKHVFDTETVATTDTSKDYFKSTLNKKKSQAIFQGDLTLVKEANLFLILQLQALMRGSILTEAEFVGFFNKGSFRWDVITPETVTVDEDRLSAIGTGPDVERFVDNSAAAVDEAVNEDRTYFGRRTYLAGENKIVPGGRAVEFSVKWEEAGGNALAVDRDLSIIFAGGEYEPGPAA